MQQNSQQKLSHVARKSHEQSQSVSYLSSTPEVRECALMASSSQSERQSSSFQIPDQKISKKKKKKRKNSSKQKSSHNEKANQNKLPNKIKLPQNQKPYAKGCGNLDRFFSVSLPVQQLYKKRQSLLSPIYTLSSAQASYLNIFQLGYGLSLQPIQISLQQKPHKSKISLKQRSLSRYLHHEKIIKLKDTQNSIRKQRQQATYSTSYQVMKRIINKLKESDDVHQFFKTSMQKVTSSQKMRRYYYQHNQIVDNSLDLQTIQEMLQDRQINNFYQFQVIFKQMITNSNLIHHHLRDSEMIECTRQVQVLFQGLYLQYACPWVGDMERQEIKTKAFIQRPKSKKIALEGQEKQVQYMDLQDKININRVKVLNYFLNLLMQSSDQQHYSTIHRIQNLIRRYQNDKVQLAVRTQARKPQLPKSAGKSPEQTKKLQINARHYQILPKQISLNLFQQLKQLIKSEIKQKKRTINRGLDANEIMRNVLYPHDDSQDFDQDSQDT